MGEKLIRAFEMAKASGGAPAEMRLAMKSGISREKAASEADSPDKITKLELTLEGIIGKSVKL